MKNKGKMQLLALTLVAVLAVVAGFGGGLLAAYTGGFGLGPGGGEYAPSGQQAPGNPSGGDISINVSHPDWDRAEAIAEKAVPSVVGISTVSTVTVDPFSSGLGGIFGYGFGGGTYDAKSVGTGVIVDESGYILTNSHVVNDGRTKSIIVSLHDGRDMEGTVLWNDPTLDLALVRIDAVGLRAAELGDSDEVRLGSYAAAIGNPLGLDFERSITQGIISGLDRRIVASGGGTPVTMEGLIQTDATINSGNSGGPLLNKSGEVIGINTAKASGGEGLSFAVPINVAKPIVKQFKEKGSFERAYIGIRGIGLKEVRGYTDEMLIKQVGSAEGIYITDVISGGGAEEAGLLRGDIILKIEGAEVSTMNRLNTYLVRFGPGDEVELDILRKGEKTTVTVVLRGDSSTL